MKAKTLRIIAIIFLIGLVLVVLAGGIYFASVKTVKLDSDTLENLKNPVLYFDSEGKEINDFTRGKNAAYVPIEELPKYVSDAFISIEDRQFYNHEGVDLRRVFGAAIDNVKSGSFKEGASTITQQLAKNTHLSNKKTIERKIQEFKLARELENKYTKDEILTMYLNVVYFGNGAYGIESASKLYFGKQAKNLTVAEAALLAGVINSPSKYSPVHNFENAVSRKNSVLDSMLKSGRLTEQDYASAKNQQIEVVREIADSKYGQNFYISAVFNELEQIAAEQNIKNFGGYRIHTYYNPNIQSVLHSATLNHGVLSADNLSIVLDNSTGGICGFFGDSFYTINMRRQPGSTLKPLAVYSPALEYGHIAPSTMILDEPVDFDGYRPQNYGGGHKGYLSAREAVKTSNNVAAVKVLSYVGIEKSKEFLSRNGIILDKNDKNMAIALGGLTYGLTLSELAQGYSTYANEGMFYKSGFIKLIQDANGKTVYSHISEPVRAMSAPTAYLTLDMLKSTVDGGTAKKLKGFDFDLGAKTGTVGNAGGNTDAYCMAITSSHTVGVWAGAKAERMPNSTTGGSLEIPKAILQGLYSKIKPAPFKIPSGVEWLEYDNYELQNNQRLVKPNVLTPKSEYAGDYFSVLKPAENNITLINPVLNAEYDGETVNFVFETDSRLKYRLYKDSTVIYTVDGKNGTQHFSDTSQSFGLAGYTLTSEYPCGELSYSETKYVQFPDKSKKSFWDFFRLFR